MVRRCRRERRSGGAHGNQRRDFDIAAQHGFVADQDPFYGGVVLRDGGQKVDFPPVADRVTADPGAGHDAKPARPGQGRNIAKNPGNAIGAQRPGPALQQVQVILDFCDSRLIVLAGILARTIGVEG